MKDDPCVMYESTSALRAGRPLSFQDSFERIEDKFLYPRSRRADLLDLLHGYMPRSRAEGDSEFTLIESVYFDTSSHRFLMDHLTGKKKRHKLRVRRYAPDGLSFDSTAFVEAKSKRNKVTTKERLRIGSAERTRVDSGRGLEVTSRLSTLNMTLSEGELDARVGRLNELLVTIGARPSIAITYRRVAFERGNLRVTVDSDVQFRPLSPMSRSSADVLRAVPKLQAHKAVLDDRVIVEVKHAGERPEWLDRHFAGAFVNQAKFSKYCWCMNHVVEEAVR
jgi:SPX domain protein involved in polyphosphate accumulation